MTSKNCVRFFDEQFPDAVPLLPNLGHDYFTNPTGSLVTIRCSPWHVGDRVVLLGDAAHAVVPFLGQGMNAAFEDCTVLARCLAQHAAAPTRRRSPTSNSSGRRMSIRSPTCASTISSRCAIASARRWFLFRKKVQNLLHKLFPRWYLPLYTMVSFTTIPYAAARRRARRQDWIVRRHRHRACPGAVCLGSWWWGLLVNGRGRRLRLRAKRRNRNGTYVFFLSAP